ncbi:uncharacterized protein EV422DRAFT_236197 [Fimicolochytrium jonesii]|uniref:uncharacterized protein n=1 Tax=Fimicolochytrium jonesii TaxID=1396493 RepID=UPI0022FE89C0|nr:uncharacterized protein EV422DRAFT_236197 [Fimicolochytrium jonesii]KAI8824863.1 hypothetical protein EV422DRAFT_236197 [Fimicolochytrium jonesii]
MTGGSTPHRRQTGGSSTTTGNLFSTKPDPPGLRSALASHDPRHPPKATSSSKFRSLKIGQKRPASEGPGPTPQAKRVQTSTTGQPSTGSPLLRKTYVPVIPTQSTLPVSQSAATSHSSLSPGPTGVSAVSTPEATSLLLSLNVTPELIPTALKFATTSHAQQQVWLFAEIQELKQQIRIGQRMSVASWEPNRVWG